MRGLHLESRFLGNASAAALDEVPLSRYIRSCICIEELRCTYRDNNTNHERQNLNLRKAFSSNCEWQRRSSRITSKDFQCHGSWSIINGFRVEQNRLICPRLAAQAHARTIVCRGTLLLRGSLYDIVASENASTSAPSSGLCSWNTCIKSFVSLNHDIVARRRWRSVPCPSLTAL